MFPTNFVIQLDSFPLVVLDPLFQVFRVFQFLYRRVGFRVPNVVNNVVPRKPAVFQVVRLPVTVRFVGRLCRFSQEANFLFHAAYACYASRGRDQGGDCVWVLRVFVFLCSCPFPARVPFRIRSQPCIHHPPSRYIMRESMISIISSGTPCRIGIPERPPEGLLSPLSSVS